MQDKPNPGSNEAIEQGCLCSIFDNDNGRGCGYVGADGQPLFWINQACPLHGMAADNKEQCDG